MSFASLMVDDVQPNVVQMTVRENVLIFVIVYAMNVYNCAMFDRLTKLNINHYKNMHAI